MTITDATQIQLLRQCVQESLTITDAERKGLLALFVLPIPVQVPVAVDPTDPTPIINPPEAA